MRTKSLLLFLSVTVLFQITLFGQNATVGYRNGMVATAHPLASSAGIEMLKSGGNAVDAAVAAAFTIGVVEPDGSGIGGGGGMVIYLKKENKSIFINYYGISSENTSTLVFDSKKDAYTAKSICVPGTVAGLLHAHKQYGKLSLKKVLEPAIFYAENGFAIDVTLAKIMLDNIDNINADSATASIFLSDGFPRMEGDTLIQKDLAKTLRLILKNGRDGFYKGEVAEEFVKGIKKRGGVLTLKDFASYDVKSMEPLKGTYRGYDILSANVSQSGVSLIEGLNILENYDLKSTGHFSESAKSFHIIAETEKYIYTDRNKYLGDPAFVDVPVNGLISKEFAKKRFESINQTKLDPPTYRAAKYADPYPYNEKKVVEKELDGGHTTHLSVIDKDGNAVSLTQTLGLFFGSGQTINGVLFNCAMTNFSFNSDNANYVQNGKQPRSSISPTIMLKDSKPFLVLGSPGAGRIISTVLELVLNVIDYGMSVEDANNAPRFYCQKFDDFIHIESGIKPEVRSDLEAMGHKLKVYEGIDLFFGGAQIILIDPKSGIYTGSADKRRGGVVLGY